MRATRTVKLQQVNGDKPPLTIIVDVDEIAALLENEDGLTTVVLKGSAWLMNINGTPDQLHKIINT